MVSKDPYSFYMSKPTVDRLLKELQDEMNILGITAVFIPIAIAVNSKEGYFKLITVRFHNIDDFNLYRMIGKDAHQLWLDMIVG